MILIATPTAHSITAGTTAALIRLARRHPDARFIAPIGIYISQLRESCARTAVEMGASHLLFVDADMRFPEDALDCLLARKRMIVAANYVQRTFPEWCVARRERRAIGSAGKTGCELVESVGCGLMLIDTLALSVMDAPRFEARDEGQIFVGEDVYFCRQARRKGIEVWVDHDLSQRVRHEGTIEHAIGATNEAGVGG